MKNQIYSIIKKILIFTSMYILIINFLNCRRDTNPISIKDNSNYFNYCDPTIPDSIPGNPGKWELVGLKEKVPNPLRALSINPEKPYVIYAGTSYNFSDGTDALLLRSFDYGLSWDTLGNAFGYGSHFNDIVFDPYNSNIIYIANGTILFRSNDCGETWQDITGNIRISWETSIWNIAADPMNQGVVYVGTGGFHGGDLYKSIDEGDNWMKIESDAIDGPYCIAIDPTDPDIIYTSVEWIGSISKSTNGGATWEFTGLHHTGVIIYDILIDSENSDILYTTLEYIIDPDFEVDFGVMKSDDAGETWTRFNNGLPEETSFVPTELVQNKFTGDLYLSVSLGDSLYLYTLSSGSTIWEKQEFSIKRNGLKNVLEYSPKDNILYFGQVGLYRIKF